MHESLLNLILPNKNIFTKFEYFISLSKAYCMIVDLNGIFVLKKDYKFKKHFFFILQAIMEMIMAIMKVISINNY